MNTKFKAEKFKETIESLKEVSHIAVLTGERGMFDLFKSIDDNEDFRMEENPSLMINSKKNVIGMGLTFTHAVLWYKNIIRIELGLLNYLDNREYNKELSPRGGVESSYNCYLITF